MLHLECYADERLARSLGVPRRLIRHEHCTGNIISQLRRLEAGPGLLDENPQAAQPRELKHYRSVKETASLRLLQHEEVPGQRLIILCPRLEEWLYRCASACGVDPQDYGLPEDPESLKARPRYDRDSRFGHFLETLCRENPEVQTLANRIRHALALD